MIYKPGISATTNANTLTATGWYFAGGGTGGTSYNFPTTTAGLLEVFNVNNTFYIQRYTPYIATTVYIRGYYAGAGWSAWKTYTGV